MMGEHIIVIVIVLILFILYIVFLNSIKRVDIPTTSPTYIENSRFPKQHV